MTPQIAIFMIIFLLLGLLSIGVNSKKGTLNKKQKDKYLKKFKIIKRLTIISITLFILSIIIGFILEYYIHINLSNGRISIRSIILGSIFLLLSTCYHYFIILKVTK